MLANLGKPSLWPGIGCLNVSLMLPALRWSGTSLFSLSCTQLFLLLFTEHTRYLKRVETNLNVIARELKRSQEQDSLPLDHQTKPEVTLL